MGARRKTRVLLLAAAVMCGALLAAVAITTRDSGTTDATSVDTPEHAAQQRCERDVVSRMVTPSTAKVSDVTVTDAQLDPEVMDLFALLSGGSLNGIDHSRISVRSVGGVVEVPSEVGGTLRDPFTCRAYFVDGDLVDTLVVFDHDH